MPSEKQSAGKGTVILFSLPTRSFVFSGTFRCLSNTFHCCVPAWKNAHTCHPRGLSLARTTSPVFLWPLRHVDILTTTQNSFSHTCDRALAAYLWVSGSTTPQNTQTTTTTTTIKSLLLTVERSVRQQQGMTVWSRR